MDTFTIQLLFGVTMFFAAAAIIAALVLAVGLVVQFFMPNKKIMTTVRFIVLLALSFLLQFASISLQAVMNVMLGNLAHGFTYFGCALLLGFAIWLLLHPKHKIATQ